MIAYSLITLFILTAIITAITLADCAVRFRNAWRIARRELASIQADLTVGTDQYGGNVIAWDAASRADKGQQAVQTLGNFTEIRAGAICAAA